MSTSAVLDYESKSSYSVAVNVSDGNGGTDDISVTIKVTDVNEAPAFSDGDSTTRSIAENVAANINIGSAVSAVDPEGSKLTYTLVGTDTASFSLDSTTGQLKTKVKLDYESKKVYSVSITVSDGSLTDSITVTINVTNLDETPSNNPPVFTDGTSTKRSIAENTAADKNIGTPIAAKDADNNRLAYLLSGTDASSFSIDDTNGQLKTNADLNHETKSSYTVVVTVTDGSDTDTITGTINVTDVNEAPVITANTDTTLSIAENTAAGLNIGATVSATDPDDGDTLTYSLAGADASSFDIVSTSGQLQTKAPLDYESKTSYSVTITVSDTILTDAIDITINVSDVDENRTPVFTDGDSTTRSVAENTGSGVNIGSAIGATDADDDDLTYSLSGTDAASFGIDSSSGQLRTKAALDYETKNSYSVTITVTDGTLTDEIDITINVADVDENRAPVFTDGDSTTRSVVENTGSGVSIGSAVVAIDADNDDLTYTLVGTDAESFSINSTNGQLRTSAALDYESKTSYSVTITVSDGNGGEDEITVTISVTDVTEITITPVGERTQQVRDAIVKAAGVDSADDVTTEHLAKITSLDLTGQTGQRITTLKAGDFDGLTVLRSLELNDNQISDISVIEGLTTLTYLNLYYNDISDISPLENLTKLKRLHLQINQISDISPLEDLTELKELSFNINQVSDITPLAGLTKLNTLEMFQNRVTDITPLAGLTKLRRLYLSDNLISDISTVAGLTKLTQLFLSNNLISDISAFEDLTKLTSVNLHDNRISDINPLQNLTKLSRITLNNNSISDISVLEGLTLLFDISIKGNPISEYGPLRRPYLKIDIDINNNPLVFSDGDSTTRSVAENTEVGQSIGTPVTATDSDTSDTLTYSLSGTDAASFDIVSTSGQLQTKAALDYEIKTSYSVTITVYDGNSDGDSISVTINVTDVDGAAPSVQTSPEIPDNTVLLSNFPNPFNPETWIPYQLANASNGKITIYDARGVIVRRLELGHQRAGYYITRSSAAHWDGRNAQGEPVASGVYFYKLSAGQFSATRKMLILK